MHAEPRQDVGAHYKCGLSGNCQMFSEVSTHLKDGVLTEVDKALRFLLVSVFIDIVMQEKSL